MASTAPSNHLVSEQARQISVSILVVHARDDHTVPINAGRALAAWIPNILFEIVEHRQLEGTGGPPDVGARIIKFCDEDSGVAVPVSPK